MNAALLLIATLVAGQAQPPADKPMPPKPPMATEAEAEEEAEAKEIQPVFTLDQIAAGAKNDAFVDEFVKDKTLRLYGRVLQIERLTTGEKPDVGYRVLMGRLGHEDRAVDLEVSFLFPLSARKELALLNPGTTKLAIEGTCAATNLQSLVNGVGFMLVLKDCKIVETPAGVDGTVAPPRSAVLPVVTPIVPPMNPPQAPLPANPPGPQPE